MGLMVVLLLYYIIGQSITQQPLNNDICKDVIENCAEYLTRGYCGDGQLKTYMQQACRKTCNYCDNTDDVNQFVYQTISLDPSNIDNNNVHFSNNNFPSNGLMIEQTISSSQSSLSDSSMNNNENPLYLKYTVQIDPKCLALFDNGNVTDLDKVYNNLPNECFNVTSQNQLDTNRKNTTIKINDGDDDDEDQAVQHEKINENFGSEIHHFHSKKLSNYNNESSSFNRNYLDFDDFDEEDEHVQRN